MVIKRAANTLNKGYKIKDHLKVVVKAFLKEFNLLHQEANLTKIQTKDNNLTKIKVNCIQPQVVLRSIQLMNKLLKIANNRILKTGTEIICKLNKLFHRNKEVLSKIQRMIGI